MEQVDILAVGSHPDDVEIGMGGTIASQVKIGYKVGIVDLTRGEMSTNGTVEERRIEGEKAMQILKCSFRHNLELPDGGVETSKDNMLKLVRVIRLTKPKVIFAPYWEDKHPDHIACSKLIQEASFISGLKKFLPQVPIYKPKQVVFYLINPLVEPSFVVNVTESYDLKKRAVLAHASQFMINQEQSATELNAENGYPERLETRDKYFGLLIGAKYGEGFKTKTGVPMSDLVSAWS